MTSLISAVWVWSEWRAALDRDSLGETFQAQRELQIQRAADLEDDFLGLQRKARQHRRDFPFANLQRREEESSFGVRDAFDQQAARGMPDAHRRARQNAP